MPMKTFRRFVVEACYKDLSPHERAAVHDYLDDTEQDWDPEKSQWEMTTVKLADLEKAHIRPLLLQQVDRGMAGQTKTEGPIMLDHDNSVIDGMHRIADAIAHGVKSLTTRRRIKGAY